jgi:hypothetical protein
MDRLPPHSPEAERGVIGCIINDPTLIDTCHERFGYRQVFYELRHRDIYNTLASLRSAKKPIDTTTIPGELRSAGKLDAVGGLAYILECSDSVPSSTALPYYLDELVTKADLRELIQTCSELSSEAYDRNGDAREFLEVAKARMAGFASAGPMGKLDGQHTWGHLADLDTDNDPNCLIGRRYLCRGHGAWLIGPSGIGKSSLLLQLAVALCLGRPVYGIQGQRPLRCLVVQAENDEGDLAEMVKGLVEGMGLSEFEDPGSWELLQRNLHIRTTTGRTGAGWCGWLRQQIEATNAELVLVDPLLSFAGIDVSRQDQCSQFLRVYLDPVLRETGAAMIAAHHTGKPPKKEGGSRQVAAPTIYETAYAGLGSSELVNWARACIVLDPVGDGHFRLTLSKRGQRAGATHPSGEPTRVVWLRHAARGIFWEQMDPPEEAPEEEQKPEKRQEGGRPSKAKELACSNIHEVIAAIPPDGLSARKMGDALHSYSRKRHATVGLSTCRGEVLDLLVENGKLSFDEASGTYKRGSNA